MNKIDNYAEDDSMVTIGSENIFADIGCTNPDEMMVKSKIVMKIEEEIKARGLTQAKAAKLIGIPQPRISRIFKGDFRDISEDKLLHCLNILGYDIKISVVKHKEKQNEMALGHTTLSFA